MMKDLIISLFGYYTPLIDIDGHYVSGLAGVDWSWVSGVFIFSICLFSLLRIIGVLFKGRL